MRAGPNPPDPADRSETTVILVVEDDAAERARIVRALAGQAGTVVEAASVAEALRACAASAPDLVLLDLGLPDGDGLEVLARVRAVSDAPVLVYSGRAGEADKVAMLDAGADDFVTKPVGAEELAARIRALLRRASALDGMHDAPRLAAPGLEVDFARERVVRDGAAVRLSPTEWSLLRALAMHAGRTLTHAELWRLVWGREFGDARLHLRVHITHLRRKIEREPSRPALIVTEPGVGYRFELP